MKIAFRESFTRDLKKVKDQTVLDRVRESIEQVESAATLHEVGDIRKLAGTINFHGIRVGEYRIGVAVDGERVEFIRCLPRRDLYRYFP